MNVVLNVQNSRVCGLSVFHLFARLLTERFLSCCPCNVASCCPSLLMAAVGMFAMKTFATVAEADARAIQLHPMPQFHVCRDLMLGCTQNFFGPRMINIAVKLYGLKSSR